jgi:hypothetical protein
MHVRIARPFALFFFNCFLSSNPGFCATPVFFLFGADQGDDSNYKCYPSPRPSRDSGNVAGRKQSDANKSVGTSHLNMKISSRSKTFDEPIEDLGDRMSAASLGRRKVDRSAASLGNRSQGGSGGFSDDEDFNDDDEDDDFWYEETLDRDSNKDHSHGGGAFKGTGNRHDRNNANSLVQRGHK